MGYWIGSDCRWLAAGVASGWDSGFFRRSELQKTMARSAAIPPRQRNILHEAILREILQERVVSSRNRVNFRGVKRKMSNYNLRPRKRQRTRRIAVSKRIRIVK